jgi:1-pyrroline-5-carboxylate dehydrogenase
MATKVTYISTSLPSDEQNAAFDAAVADVRSKIGAHGLIIGGTPRPGGAGTFDVANPANHDETLGTYAEASTSDVADAVAAARAAARAWSATPYTERARILQHAADLIRERVMFLGAVVALEVGKNRVESVGEVEEGADLISYYCDQLVEHHAFRTDQASQTGEDTNTSVLRPYGVFGVISPFNFPSALAAGPIGAALVAGNTVVFKPAETTPWSGVLLAEILHEAGVPGAALNLVTGGPAVGKALVAASGVDGIAFTGSYDVGREIYRTFAVGESYSRPCITEMGGKNPTIVTATADLAKAANGILRSAFGASGQKCSACSRVLVDERVHDALLDQLAEGAQSWTVADPVAADCRLGPVNNAEAYEKYRQAAADARRDGRIVAGAEVLTDGAFARGYFVAPTIVADLPAGHRLTRDELFVPFVVVERAAGLEAAIAAANSQSLGLTAGLFSEDDDEKQQFLDGIEAGVVYVNRAAGSTTGAWPGYQTFGGWKGSGSTGKSAFGPHYVQLFMREQSRTILP